MSKTSAFRHLLVVAAVLFLSVDPTSAQDRTSPAQRDPKSVANLYLMRNLEHTLNTWKAPTANPYELGSWISTTRNRLNALKTTAEAYKLDEDIIRAYGDVLALLADYEEYLKDVVLHDLMANLAKPEQKSLKAGMASVATGAVTGGAAGATVGSVVPFIGNAIGAGVGATVSAGAAAVNWFAESQDAINKNEKIDAKVKESRRHLIEHLTRHFASTVAKLKVLAGILGGKKKYSWGDEVGFDGSERQPYEKQRRLRPNDSFLHVVMGIQEASSNPKVAAERLARAAELVPQDFDPDVFIFRKDRAEFLLTAARIAEYGARQGGGGSELATQAVAYYRAARRSLKDGDPMLSHSVKVMYARACALAGLEKDANETMEQLLQQAPNDPWLCYEYAGVKAVLGKSGPALDYLRLSFKAQPRWQPHALSDSRLAYLNSTHKAEVERICANPLIARWEGDKGLVIDFMPDGSMRRTWKGETETYSYQEVEGNKITVQKSPTNSVTWKYSVTKTKLRLEGGNVVLELNRYVPRLLGAWKYISNDEVWIEYNDNGVWRGKNGSSVKSGTWYAISSTRGAGPELRCVSENIVLGIVEKRFEYRITGDTLELRPWEETQWYEYKRR